MKFQISGNTAAEIDRWGVTWRVDLEPCCSSFPDWSVGHGNGTCRNTVEGSYLLAWMEFRDRSTHAVRERKVLYRLIVR